MNKKKLYGTGVALITPFNSKNKVDFEALNNIINHVINGGVNYIVIFGTTGEPYSLTKNEKNDVVKFIIDINNNRVPLVLNIGGKSTNKVIKDLEKFELNNFKAILSVSPYYSNPSQEGIYQHFKFLAKNLKQCNFIIYNVPKRTGSNISPKTTIRLANNFENIIGIKEASGNILQSYEIIKNIKNNFSIISGDDSLTLPIIMGGGVGVISVLAQAFPKEITTMVNLALQNNIKESYDLFYNKLYDFIYLIFKEGNPTGIKTLLKSINICSDYVRLPLIKGSNKLFLNIKSKISNISKY